MNITQLIEAINALMHFVQSLPDVQVDIQYDSKRGWHFEQA